MALEQEAYELAGQPFNLGSAQADRRDLLHQARPAGRQEDAERRAEHRRRSAGKAGRGLSAAGQDPGAPRPVEAQGHLHRQAGAAGAIRAAGRVHTHYAQAVAVTGRLSSNDPNLQNIPIRTAEGRRVREAFVAPRGQRDRQRRLLADRAAHHGPHQRRRGAAARLHARAWTCTAPPRPRSSASRVGPGVERAAPLRQGDQLRPDLRHEQLRPGAQPGHRDQGGRDLHRALLRSAIRA